MREHAAEPLSEDLIKELHRILKSSTSDARKDWFRAGDYKSRPNVVGDTKSTALLDEYAGKQPAGLPDIGLLLFLGIVLGKRMITSLQNADLLVQVLPCPRHSWGFRDESRAFPLI